MDATALAAELQMHGIRPTPQRMAVYHYLLTHRTHPSADAIYAALSPLYPSFSRTTIYNSLRALEEAHLIRSVNIDPQEQHFDGDAADHGHCRCTVCGRLFDFPLPADMLAGMTPDGFTAFQQDVFLTGVCADCRAHS